MTRAQRLPNIARDITEEKRMEENLRFYVQQITRAQEEERLRIARELHDSTAQALIALLHQLENLLHDKTKLPVGEARELWALHEQIKGLLQEVRYLSRDLRGMSKAIPSPSKLNKSPFCIIQNKKAG